jgi:glycosyltransferase involved in cell wall biosynthesis
MRICLVGVLGQALLGEGTGGSERQIALLARHFVRRGHRVTMLATDVVGPDRQVDGVILRAAWDPHKGIPRVRAVTYRYPTLAGRLLRERADLYYVRGATPFSPVVLRVARHLDSPGLLGLASDHDLRPESGQVVLGLGSSRSHRVASYAGWIGLQRHALRLADAVVAQNTGQADRCAAMGLPHVVIPSIVEEPRDELLTMDVAYDVVWVGNVDSNARRSKGLDALAELAARVPEVRFAVVGRLKAATVSKQVARLGTLPNVALLGAQPYEEAQRSIARSRMVLNTSPAEGFSNVMLEGWALAKPALTLSVNPSSLLGDDGLGRCANGNLDHLIALLKQSLADEAWLAAAGQRAQEYVRTVHAADAVCSRYEELAQALRTGRRGRGV